MYIFFHHGLSTCRPIGSICTWLVVYFKGYFT